MPRRPDAEPCARLRRRGAQSARRLAWPAWPDRCSAPLAARARFPRPHRLLLRPGALHARRARHAEGLRLQHGSLSRGELPAGRSASAGRDCRSCGSGRAGCRCRLHHYIHHGRQGRQMPARPDDPADGASGGRAHRRGLRGRPLRHLPGHEGLGEVDMHHNGGILDDEIEEGYILACCSRPVGDVSIEA
jgi:hypothetical protein